MTDSVALAEAEAAAARGRMNATLATLQARIAPKALAQEAAQGLLDKGQAVADTGMAVARRNPIAVAGAIAAAGLLLARKPIARLFTRGNDATSPATDSLTIPKFRAVKRKPK